MQLYLFPFLLSLVLSVSIVVIILWLAKKFPGIAIKGKSQRHIHKKNVPRLGGVAIILAFLGTVLIDRNLFISQPLWGIVAACFFVLIIGLWDDFQELSWKNQLFFQVAISVLIFIFGVHVEYVTNPTGGLVFLNIGRYLLPSLIFVILWVSLIINSMNCADGIDGLSGGITLIGALTIFFLSLKPEVNQPPVGIITAALAGAVLGFLLFNFYPAKIFAGTSGSWFMGFILAVLAIFAGTKIATALLVIAIPIIDIMWVAKERIVSGVSVFDPDYRHLHFKLIKLGWSQKKVALFFYAVTIIIAAIALNTRAIGKLVTIMLVIFVMVVALMIVDQKIKAKQNQQFLK
jgi:UDP-GlcNAc:undecaprenyl-phosphate/decaprenyl-phosphate GlcNAc-1-phosphate transferase